MNKLYIIGNGFDLFHNLPTSYNDFHKFVIKHHSDLQNTFEEYFVLSTNHEYLWTNFENDLSTFRWKAFFNDINQIDVLDDGFQLSSIYGLEDDLDQETEKLVNSIRQAFEDWITDISFDSTVRKLSLNDNSVFLNFNYTMTLEEVYQISDKNILHIHGDVENSLGSLIFGHNKNLKRQPEFDTQGERTRGPLSDSEANAQQSFFKLQKQVKDTIHDYNTFFKGLNNIDEIIILGHSLNSIDLPYFKTIKKYAAPETKWKVSFYNDDERARHLKALLKIRIDESKIEFFKMSELNSL